MCKSRWWLKVKENTHGPGLEKGSTQEKERPPHLAFLVSIFGTHDRSPRLHSHQLGKSRDSLSFVYKFLGKMWYINLALSQHSIYTHNYLVVSIHKESSRGYIDTHIFYVVDCLFLCAAKQSNANRFIFVFLNSGPKKLSSSGYSSCSFMYMDSLPAFDCDY